MWKWILLGVLVLVAGLAAVAYARYRAAAADAERAMADLLARARPAVDSFEPSMLAGLPEIAQRYFQHAIAPGTPLSTVVRLEMEGTFLLGDAASFQTFGMKAVEVLASPSEFVWMPRMTSGPMQVSGSDGLVAGAAWTRFWINGMVPVVNAASSPDLVRSARARSALESIWAPASLLPQNGVSWEQTGADTARLTFATGIEPLDLTLDARGRVVELVTMRWSDANPDKSFQLQPFGGTIEAEAAFGGFTIPSQVKVGNHFGTDAYLPFFQGRITAAEYFEADPGLAASTLP